jgi:hypothetical protein
MSYFFFTLPGTETESDVWFIALGDTPLYQRSGGVTAVYGNYELVEVCPSGQVRSASVAV